MIFPAVCLSPDAIAHKARLARRRAPRVFLPILTLDQHLRMEACQALRWIITDYWHTYRDAPTPEVRVNMRARLRSQIAAIRLFSV